jgi:hypothetical protein
MSHGSLTERGRSGPVAKDARRRLAIREECPDRLWRVIGAGASGIPDVAVVGEHETPADPLVAEAGRIGCGRGPHELGRARQRGAADPPVFPFAELASDVLPSPRVRLQRRGQPNTRERRHVEGHGVPVSSCAIFVSIAARRFTGAPGGNCDLTTRSSSSVSDSAGLVGLVSRLAWKAVGRT